MPRAPYHLPAIKRALAAADSREMRSCDLARAVELKGSTLLAAVAPGLRDGVLEKRQEGRSVFYRLADGIEVEPAEDEPAQPSEIRWSIWDDGDLVVYGLQENEDGSHTVPAQVLEAIRKRIAWSPAQA